MMCTFGSIKSNDSRLSDDVFEYDIIHADDDLRKKMENKKRKAISFFVFLLLRFDLH